MAGWTTTDWTAGAIQKHTDEIWKAFNERKQAWGSTAVPVPQAGANIQKGFYYNYYSGGPIPPATPPAHSVGFIFSGGSSGDATFLSGRITTTEPSAQPITTTVSLQSNYGRLRT